ncbi:MAG TPA: hypothetical protein VM261_18995 [Kofleriaceae bacterium]|nr:hypothetical protein [Kofleriaceae bacterium]
MLRKVGLGLLFATLVAACGSARIVSRTQYGGIVALQGDRGKAMEQAHKEMAAHCGAGNYAIVQEGEEVIGTDTVAQSDTNYGEDTAYAEGTQNSGDSSATAGGASTRGGSSTNAQTSTRNAVEWRVHYQCGGAPAGAGPAPMAPPPPPSGGGAPPPPGY